MGQYEMHDFCIFSLSRVFADVILQYTSVLPSPRWHPVCICA